VRFLTIAATSKRQEKETGELSRPKKMQEALGAFVVRQLIHHPRYYYR
jgi:hypothetical protein